MISASFMVPYRESRLCSGATFPVLLVNCHGGSTRMLPKRRPFAKHSKSRAPADSAQVPFATTPWPGLTAASITFARDGPPGLAPSGRPADADRACPLVFDI